MKAMILAAGRGERMRPLTDAVPKPLLRIAGKPLIEYHVESLARAGVEAIVVNLSWQGARIREYLGDGSKYGLKITYSDEGDVALETGGGVFQALPQLGAEPFWLVNGDVYCEFEYPSRQLPGDRLAHLLMVPNPQHNLHGDFVLDQELVRADGGTRSTYSGIALLSPGLFDDSSPGKFPLAPLLVNAMRAGRVGGECFEGVWIDVGTPERLRDLDARLSAERQPAGR